MMFPLKNDMIYSKPLVETNNNKTFGKHDENKKAIIFGVIAFKCSLGDLKWRVQDKC